MTVQACAPDTPHGTATWSMTTAVSPGLSRSTLLTVTLPDAMVMRRMLCVPRTADALVTSNPAGGVVRTEPNSRITGAIWVRVMVTTESVPAATGDGPTSTR